MNNGDKVGVYKFFKGVLTEYEGTVYARNDHWLGLIQIQTKTKHSIMASTKPGVIRNNFIWFEGGLTPKNKLEAISIFDEREGQLKVKAEKRYENALLNQVYLNREYVKTKEELSCQKD